MHSSTKAGLGAASMVLAAGAVLSSTLGGGAQAAAGHPAASGDHPIVTASASDASASTVSSAKAGKVGWQGKVTYSLPAGAGGVFFHYACPSGLVARSGGFNVNGAGQPGVRVVGSSPWQDQNYSEWFHTLLWSGGAPSGVTIDFDVYCTKAPI